jgi:hypothetical protein
MKNYNIEIEWLHELSHQPYSYKNGLHLATTGFDSHRSHFQRLRSSRPCLGYVEKDSLARRAVEIISSHLPQFWGINE